MNKSIWATGEYDRRIQRYQLLLLVSICLLLLPFLVFANMGFGEDMAQIGDLDNSIYSNDTLLSDDDSRVGSDTCGNMELDFVSSALWSYTNDIDGCGDFIYCAMGNGLMVLDISDLQNISIASTHYISDNCLSVYINKKTLYLGTRTQGMMIFDISDGDQPQLIDHIESPARVWGVEIKNDTLYQLGNDSLYIYDLDNGINPELLGGTDYAIWGGQDKRSIAIGNNVAYVAAGKLTSIDVFDKHNPTPLDTLKTWHEAIELEIRDTIIIVADRSIYSIASYSSLTIVNAKLPAHMHSVGMFEFIGSFWDMVIDGNYVYGAMGEYRFAVFDISDLLSPQLVSCFTGADGAKSLYLKDNHIFMGGFKNSFPEDVAWTGDICHQFDYFDSSTISPSPPLNPGDFIVLDIEEPENPTYVGRFENPGYINRLTVQDDIVFTSDDLGSITSTRILPNGKLEFLDVLQVGYGSDGLDADGNYLAVAKSLKTVDIIDISSPTNMEKVGTYNGVDWIPDVFLSDTIMFVCEGGTGLSIVNIADPTQPILISRTNTADAAVSIIVEDNIAYIACRYGGLEIIDVSNVQAPIKLGQFPEEGESEWYIYLAKEGDILATGATGVWNLIDVSDPAEPALLNEYYSSGPWGITIKDKFMYLAGGHSGVEIVDISDPSHPCKIGSITNTVFPLDVTTTNEFLLVANSASLLSFRLPVPTDIIEEIDSSTTGQNPNQHFNCFPNPFNSSTTIEFAFTEHTIPTLEIYNITGQRVKSIDLSSKSFGLNTVVWDGTNFHGAQVASGMYLCRLSTKQNAIARKIILLK